MAQTSKVAEATVMPALKEESSKALFEFQDFPLMCVFFLVSRMKVFVGHPELLSLFILKSLFRIRVAVFYLVLSPTSLLLNSHVPALPVLSS